MAVTVQPIADQTVQDVSPIVIALANHFSEPEVTGTIVRLQTNAPIPNPDLYIELFDAAGPGRSRTTPITASNFLAYVNDGSYDNTVFHRLSTGYVLQGGGYKTPTQPAIPVADGSDPVPLVARSPIVNEPGNSNVRGTIAMAKPVGQPNGATSQFFFNLVDNSGSLNSSNDSTGSGGFTVFGRLLGQAGVTVVDAMSKAEKFAADGYYTNPEMAELPLWTINGNQNVQPSDFLQIRDASTLPKSELISFTLASSDTSKLTASIVGGNLVLTPVVGQWGNVSITVTGRSLADNSTASDTFVVSLPPIPPGAVTNVVAANVVATPSNGQVRLTWVAPTNNGGAPVTDYVIEFSNNDGVNWTRYSDGISASTVATVNGLANGTSYVFRVAAVNAVGTGSFSAKSVAVRPTNPSVATSVFGDTFTRTDGTSLSSPWQVHRGALTVQQGRGEFARVSSGSTEALATVSGLVAADVRVQADAALNSSTYVGLVARHTGVSGKDTFYVGYLTPITGGARGEIWRCVAGVWARIGVSGMVATSGQLQFEVQGTQLSLLLDGMMIVTAIDSAITGAGSAGFQTIGGAAVGATIDNVIVSRIEARGLPRLVLASDTGLGEGDWITKTGVVNVSGLATGAAWQWSSNSGSTWATGVGTSFTLAAGTYAAGSVLVRPVLIPSNVTRNAVPITVDITVPAAPVLARIGTTASMQVSGLESGAAWKYSINGGSTWTAGLGTGSFTLPDGGYLPGMIRVVQTDLAGNDSVSTSHPTAMLIETSGTVTSVSDSFARPDGSPLPLPWQLATGGGSITSGRLTQLTAVETVAVIEGLSASDVRVQAVVNLNTAAQAGLVARVGGGTTASPALYLGYLVKTSTGANAEIWRRSTTGAWTRIGSSVAAPATSGTLKFHVVGNRLSLALNDAPLVVVEDTQAGALTAGSAGVWLKGGSGGLIDDFSVADVPSTGAIGFRLQTDSGAGSGDSVTNIGVMTVTGLDTGATWRWTRDGGTTWAPGTGTSFTLPSGSYGAGSVRVEQLAPKSKIRQNIARIVVDATAPVAPTLARTSTTVMLGGLESNANWRYSTNGGTAWTVGRGTSFTISMASAAAGQIRVTQTDAAGNESPAALLPSVTLTATQLVTDNFNRANGTVLGTATGAAGAWTAAQGSLALDGGMIRSATTATAVAVLPGFSEADVRVDARFDAATMSAAGVVARSSGTGSSTSLILGYVTRVVSGTTITYRAEIWRQRNGAWTLLSTTTVSNWTGVMRLDCAGTRLALSLDGTIVTSTTDSSTSAVTSPGTAGLWLVGPSKADEFAASRLSI